MRLAEGSLHDRGPTMSNLNVFIHVSVDGFFAGPHGEIDWFKSIEKDPEYDAFTHERSK